MAKKRKPPKKSVVSIESIIEKALPNMRVVDRPRGTRAKAAQPDAKTPDIATTSLEGVPTPDAAGKSMDDDVTFVTVEPKKAQSQDFRASSRRVVLVSKSKKKIIAQQG
jgi:hypothetical protein